MYTGLLKVIDKQNPFNNGIFSLIWVLSEKVECVLESQV